ncbi:MAG: hypothetical protein U0Q18_27570 [Bryobacteraceae bacterium]
MKSFPARLHVLLAPKAPNAVAFRRGPANAVCTVGWNRKTDEFHVGQWLRGRIYERRADLSPYGRHLIYNGCHVPVRESREVEEDCRYRPESKFETRQAPY